MVDTRSQKQAKDEFKEVDEIMDGLNYVLRLRHPHIRPLRYTLLDVLLNHKQYGLLSQVFPRFMEKLGEELHCE